MGSFVKVILFCYAWQVWFAMLGFEGLNWIGRFGLVNLVGVLWSSGVSRVNKLCLGKPESK